jgi:hypothetical protein
MSVPARAKILRMGDKNLTAIWERQRTQQRNWYDKDALPTEDREQIQSQLLLDLQDDISKLARTVGRERYHILHRPGESPENIAEAGVDAFKILISLMQLNGISAAQFSEAFYSKSDVVDNKWRCEQSELSASTTVVLVDLDGCVADWAEGFIAYCARNGKAIKPHQVNDPQLEELKDGFHGNGGFLSLRPIPDALEGLRTIRHMGYKVVIVTARPYHQFRRVYSDTMEWLKRYSVEYDQMHVRCSNKARGQC